MIVIIEGRPEDAKAVVEFTEKVGSETDNLTFGAEGLGVTSEQEALFLQEMHENPRAVFLCAWKEDTLIGTGFLGGMNNRMKHRARLAISILKSEWNKGVGSAMMEKLIGLAYPLSVQDAVPAIASFCNSPVPLLRERSVNALGRIGRGSYPVIEPYWTDLFRFAADEEA